jgi:phospholipid N-methyltransferase
MPRATQFTFQHYLERRLPRILNMEQTSITPSRKPLTPGLDFFRAFLKNWKDVGWPLETSHGAAKKICDMIDFQRTGRVIEIGAGTGSITKEVLKSLAADGQLIAFEINGDLCRHLRLIDDPRLVVHNSSGFAISRMVTGKADCVISEVPIAMLSDASFASFYQDVKGVLNEGGCCIQLQLSLFSYPRLRRVFGTVDVALSLMNSVPLFIYYCKP